MNEICAKMGDADEAQMEQYMEELGVIQDMLTMHDFYMIDAKVEEVARALGLLDLGLDRDVCELSGGQRTKVLLGKLLLEKPDILLLDEPTNYLDAEHIAWLKRYLQEYENAFILKPLCRRLRQIYGGLRGEKSPVRGSLQQTAEGNCAVKGFCCTKQGACCHKKYGDVPPEKA